MDRATLPYAKSTMSHWTPSVITWQQALADIESMTAVGY